MKRNKMPDTSRWTVEDWRDLWESMETVKDRIRRRHGMAGPAPAVVAHTPGPWRAVGRLVLAESRVHAAFGVRIVDAKNERTDLIPESEQVANARLIAAAPDLLAVCQAFADAIACQLDDPESDIWAQLRTAMAKAKGDAP